MTSAEAQIDFGTVRLHSAGCIRTWSLLRGVTEEFRNLDIESELLVGRSPEFHLEVDGTPCSALDCTEVVWSEEAGAGWAAVRADFVFKMVRIGLRTQLHGASGAFERTLEVRNFGAAAQRVSRCAAEILPLDPATCRAVALDESLEALLCEATGYGRFAAVQAGEMGLIVGMAADATWHYFDPNPRFCAVAGTAATTLAPGATALLQRTLTVMYAGSAKRAANRIADDWNKRSEAQ